MGQLENGVFAMHKDEIGGDGDDISDTSSVFDFRSKDLREEGESADNHACTNVRANDHRLICIFIMYSWAPMILVPELLGSQMASPCTLFH